MIKLHVSYVENESYQLRLNDLFVKAGCRKVKLKVVWYIRLLTCKVESCMIKLKVSYVENESYQVKLNVVFVTVGCRKVKLKVVWLSWMLLCKVDFWRRWNTIDLDNRRDLICSVILWVAKKIRRFYTRALAFILLSKCIVEDLMFPEVNFQLNHP